MAKVILSQQGYVALVTINRPEAMNALNQEVIEELIEAFDLIDVDQTRCVIITGADDRAFVAGADIAQMKDMTSDEYNLLIQKQSGVGNIPGKITIIDKNGKEKVFDINLEKDWKLK